MPIPSNILLFFFPLLLSSPNSYEKTYTDEWENFLERVRCDSEEDLKEDLKVNTSLEEELRLWVSYRGQTLTKTGIGFFVLIFTFSSYIM